MKRLACGLLLASLALLALTACGSGDGAGLPGDGAAAESGLRERD